MKSQNPVDYTVDIVELRDTTSPFFFTFQMC